MWRYKPTPNFRIAIAILSIVIGLSYVCLAIVEAAQQGALSRLGEYATSPTPRQDWRPDIRHCHDPNVDLWDCIRGETSTSGDGSSSTSTDR